MYAAPLACYGLTMLPKSIASSLLLLVLALGTAVACNDPEPPEAPPEDGSVALWGSCVFYDPTYPGYLQMPDVCQPHLTCVTWGVCAPSCERDLDCPSADGVDGICYIGECRFECDYQSGGIDAACPKTGGAHLVCEDGRDVDEEPQGYCGVDCYVDAGSVTCDP